MNPLLKNIAINKTLAALACVLFFTSSFSQDIFTVTNLRDTCCNLEDYLPGSYRWALRKAGQSGNPAGAVINFNIPGPGPFVIHFYENDLPKVTRKTIIDGLSQPGSSPGHPLIEMDGANWKDKNGNTQVSTRSHVLFDMNEPGGSSSVIRGLVIKNWIDPTNAVGAINVNDGNAKNVTVEYCFFGTDVTGKIAQPNKVGIILNTGSGWIIRNNLISGNKEYGINLIGNSNNNLIENNLVGVDIDGKPLPNHIGIQVQHSFNNIVQNNNISYNDHDGLTINYDAYNNKVYGNTITNNDEHGVDILGGGSTNNIVGLDINGVGKPNIIGNNKVSGVYVSEWQDDADGQYKGGAASKTTIRGNSIFCNGNKGINLDGRGNNTIASPVINSLSTQDLMYGTAPSGSTIDLYYGDGCNGCNSNNSQGKTYLATVKSVGGNWSFTNNTGIFSCYSLVATVTEPGGNTSQMVATCVPPKISMKDTTVCKGIDLNLDAGDCWKTYKWSTGETTQKIKITNAAGPYWVEVSDINDKIQKANFNVNITPSPTVDLGPDQTFCTGNISLDAGNPGMTYLWSTGASTKNITVNTAGTYFVKVSNTTGCVAYDTIKIKSGTPPVIKLTPPSLCKGSSTILDGGVFSSYLWTPGNANTQTLTVNTTGQYKLTATDAAGCKNSDSVLVKVFDLPVVDLGTDKNICAGENVVFDASSGFSKYAWTPSGTQQTYTANTSREYKVTVTDANGCSNKDSVKLKVNPLPVVDLGNDVNICSGITVFLDAGNAGATYIWTPTNETTPTINATNPGTYKVTVTDVNHCSSTDSINITNNSITTVSDPQPQTICENKNTFFTVVASGAKSIEWQLSSDSGATYNPVNEDAIYKNVASQTLLVKNATKNMDAYLFRAKVIGCVQDATSKEAQLTVLSSPVITKDPEDQKICATANATFSVTSPDATSYEWQVSKDGGDSYTTILNTNATDLTVQNVSVAMSGYLFRSVVKGNCDPVFSKNAKLKVDTTVVNVSVDKTSICMDQAAQLSATASPSAATYEWNTGENDSSFSVSPQIGTHTYTVVATAKGCKSEAAQVSVTVSPKPEVDAGEDQIVCPGSEVHLGKNNPENQTYVWTSDDDYFSNQANPTAKTKYTTTYFVNAKNSACPDGVSDTIVITTVDVPTLYIPNAFTPNNDGTNDIFKVAGEGILEFNGAIYDRWGELIYEWNNPAEGWDGYIKSNKLVQEDVYVYKISVKNLCDGKKISKPILGSVTVIR